MLSTRILKVVKMFSHVIFHCFINMPSEEIEFDPDIWNETETLSDWDYNIWWCQVLFIFHIIKLANARIPAGRSHVSGVERNYLAFNFCGVFVVVINFPFFSFLFWYGCYSVVKDVLSKGQSINRGCSNE